MVFLYLWVSDCYMQASTGPYFSSVVRGGHPVCPRLDVPVLHDQKKSKNVYMLVIVNFVMTLTICSSVVNALTHTVKM